MTGLNEREELDRLAEMLAKRAERKRAGKPALRLVEREDLKPKRTDELDPITRSGMIDRIRDLARMYWLAWLVRQETASVQGVLECLEDDALSALLQKMEKGRKCRVEGTGFDEADLVRPAYDEGEEEWACGFG